MTTGNIEAVVALLVPVLVSFIKQEHFPDQVNAIIALAVYALVGVAAVLVTGQTFDMNNIVPTVTLFTVEGTVAYQLFWKTLENVPGTPISQNSPVIPPN